MTTARGEKGLRNTALLVAGLFFLISAGSFAFAAPGGSHGKGHAHAHPSSSHGSNVTAAGSSGTRGKSPSRPDQDGIGMDRGLVNDDKPPAGDGNNGCGNDADREDDDNGWCGHKPAPTVTPTESVPSTSSGQTSGPTTTVLGVQFSRNVTPAPASVLGTSLARTGVSIAALALAAAMLLGAGVMLARRARTQ